MKLPKTISDIEEIHAAVLNILFFIVINRDTILEMNKAASVLDTVCIVGSFHKTVSKEKGYS